MSKHHQESKENNNQIELFQSETGELSFNVRIFNETVWLTQKQMAELFDTTRANITLHINNLWH